MNAQDLYKESLQTAYGNRDAAQTAFRMGLQHIVRGENHEAATAFKQAVALQPDFAAAYYNLGRVLRELGDDREAIAAYRKASEWDPEDPDIFYNLGNALFAAGKLDAAIKCYQRTLELNPRFVKARNNLAEALKKCGRIDAAIEQYNAVLHGSSPSAETLCKMGELFRKRRKYDQASHWYQKALQRFPDCAEAFNGLGNVLRDQNRVQEAKVCYEQAIRAAPTCARAYSNLAKTCQETGDLGKALHYYDQAVQIETDEADIRFNRATAYLMSGNFAAGWKEYTYRFKRRQWQSVYPRRFDQPLWDGSPYAGKKLYVHDEQGLGDTLQFVRYLPMAAARGGKLIFETRPSLFELFRDIAGVTRVVCRTASTQPSDLDFDYYVPLLNLPWVFNTTLETVPNHVPYLFANSRKKALWRQRLHDSRSFRVGIVWGGSATDEKRSCRLEDFLILQKTNAVRLYGLQKGPAALQALEIPGCEIPNFGPEFTDFSDTAAAIDCLDLVISVDTAVAHLAGAMGKPVWTLLPYAPDWRWMQKRSDSPWYPTMRLFRQETPGNWQTVMQQVATALKRAVAQPAA